jgi:hypothetical protein
MVLHRRASGPLTIVDRQIHGCDVPDELLTLSETQHSKGEAASARLITRVQASFSSELARVNVIQDLRRCLPHSLPLSAQEQRMKPSYQAAQAEADCSCVLTRWSNEAAWYRGQNTCPRHSPLAKAAAQDCLPRQSTGFASLTR